MKDINKYFNYFFVVIIIVFIYRNSCTSNKTDFQEIEIKTPKIEKTFDPVKPILEKIDTTKKVSQSIKKIIAENKVKIDFFNIQTDSLKSEIFTKEIEPKTFNQIFDDENVFINVSGLVSGQVYSLATNYTIKEKIQILKQPIKSKVFSLKTGVEYGNNLQFNNSIFKVNFEFENKKGNSFSYAYDTNNIHWIGCKFTVFEIKK